MSNSDLDLRG